MERWRLIKDPPMEGALNMARDEAILSSFVAGDSLPTLRLYGWSRPTISIGYAQKADRFLAISPLLPVVRRVTGGRAVLHDAELTYSIVAPAAYPSFSGGIEAAYRSIGRAIAGALTALGIEADFVRPTTRPVRGARSLVRDEACFNSYSRYEITACGRKLAGSAQRRFGEVFLQHGSILMGMDVALTETVFGPGAANKAAWTGEFSDVTGEELGRELVRSMALAFNAEFIPGSLEDTECALVPGLVEKKRIPM